MFWSRRNWQALCATCHSRKTVRQDGGFGVSAAAIERSRPSGLLPSRIPLVIVCGPSGGGKSAYVRSHATARDLIIDLDEIKVRLSGSPIYCAGPEWTVAALDERNRLLRSLAADQDHPRAWFIVQSPGAEERAWWVRMLRPERVEVVAPPLEQCISQIRRDFRRAGRVEHFIALARTWFERFAEGDASISRPPPMHRPPHLARIHVEIGDSAE